MGISADSTTKAFPSADVDKFFKRVYNGIPVDPFSSASDRNTNHVVVAVDPAGGGSSQFAVFSLCQLPNGSVMVASCPAARPPTSRP